MNSRARFCGRPLQHIRQSSDWECVSCFRTRIYRMMENVAKHLNIFFKRTTVPLQCSHTDKHSHLRTLWFLTLCLHEVCAVHGDSDFLEQFLLQVVHNMSSGGLVLLFRAMYRFRPPPIFNPAKTLPRVQRATGQ